MTAYRIVRTWKTDEKGRVYDERFSAERREWYGWRRIDDGYYPNAHMSEKECAQRTIDCQIAWEREKLNPRHQEFIKYP